MTLGRREKTLLGALGAVAVVALLAVWDGGGAADDVPRGETLAARSDRLRQAAAETPLETRVVALDLAALDAQGGEFELGRNPFRYAPAPAPPPPPPPVVVRETQQRTVTPPPPPPPPVQARCQPPSTGHLQYLGSFGSRTRRIAVVISGDEIYNVLEGGMIEDQFRVEEIGYESLALRSVKCPEEPATRLPAGGT